MTVLRARAERLYETFSRYGIGKSIETDGYPITAGPLMSAVRTIALEDIEPYACKAMTTQGSVTDFKHFLPRLFDLLTVKGSNLTPEILVGKLHYGQWTTWPAEEQKAVADFLEAWWAAVLSWFPASVDPSVFDISYAWFVAQKSILQTDVDAALCAIGQAVDDVSPYLTRWLADERTPALRHLAAFVDENWESLRDQRILNNGFWKSYDRNDPQHTTSEQVKNWLLSDRIVSHLRTHAARVGDTDIALELEQAADRLEEVMKSWK